LQRRDIAWWMTAGLLGAWLVFHFGLVLLSLLPLNPLSYGVHPLIAAYVHPLFTQNWGLFAPDPVAADSAGYARGYYHDGAQEIMTPWIDFTDPLLERVRSSRVTPLNLTVTVLSKSMTSIYIETGIADADASHREALLEKWQDPNQRPRGLVVLEAAGSAALRAVYPALNFERVQVMVSITPVPRFSKRYEPQAEPTDYLVFRPSDFPNVISWFAPAGSSN
jgi:hypothetical protein